MLGRAESLNAGMAGAVILFEASRQRRSGSSMIANAPSRGPVDSRDRSSVYDSRHDAAPPKCALSSTASRGDIGMNWQALWFVLAGLILGFALSTLWEWFYFRRERLSAKDERVAELERQLRMAEQRNRAKASGGYQSPGVLLESEQAEELLDLSIRELDENLAPEGEAAFADDQSDDDEAVNLAAALAVGGMAGTAFATSARDADDQSEDPTDKIEAHADSATAADEATDDDAMRRTAVVASAVADTNDAMEGPAVSSEADDDSLADDSTDAAAAATDDNATHRAAAAAAAVVFDEDEAEE